MTQLFLSLAGGALRGFLRSPLGLAAAGLIALALVSALMRHWGRSEMAGLAAARELEMAALRAQAESDAKRLAQLEAARAADAAKIATLSLSKGNPDDKSSAASAKAGLNGACRIRVERLR